jgi:hypothetical protein
MGVKDGEDEFGEGPYRLSLADEIHERSACDGDNNSPWEEFEEDELEEGNKSDSSDKENGGLGEVEARGVEMETPEEVIYQYYGSRGKSFIAGFREQ